MKTFVVRVVLSLLFLSLSIPVFAEGIDPQKKADIDQLMDVTGTKNIGLQFGKVMTQQIYQVIKASNPEIPDRALSIVEEETMKVITSEADDLFVQLIPVYDKHFTAEEIRELMAFYQTELGKKTIAVMPMVMNESMAVGQTWGQNLGPKLMARINARLKDENIEVKR